MKSHAIVLVIDDDQTTRTMMKLIFDSFDVQVDTATNGKEAVEMAIKNDYALILMDIEMPVMDGIEACKHIRDAKPGSIIIMVTGKFCSADEMESIKKHANAFFSKPIELEVFFATVSAIMTEHYARQFGGPVPPPAFRFNGEVA